MELGPEDVSLLERCPHFRGWYVQASMELGPEDVSPIREVSSFQRVVCTGLNGTWRCVPSCPISEDGSYIVVSKCQSRHHQPPPISPPQKRRDTQMLVLGSQLLTELRDKILCFRDFIVDQDYSEDPTKFNHHSLIRGDPPNRSKSAFFFIHNTFYNDRRHPNSQDLSA